MLLLLAPPPHAICKKNNSATPLSSAYLPRCFLDPPIMAMPIRNGSSAAYSLFLTVRDKGRSTAEAVGAVIVRVEEADVVPGVTEDEENVQPGFGDGPLVTAHVS